jgi:hypothetical protein
MLTSRPSSDLLRPLMQRSRMMTILAKDDYAKWRVNSGQQYETDFVRATDTASSPYLYDTGDILLRWIKMRCELCASTRIVEI